MSNYICIYVKCHAVALAKPLLTKRSFPTQQASGRKRPRLADIDVVSAGDAEPVVTTELIAALTSTPFNIDLLDENPTEHHVDHVIQQDICHKCQKR